MTISFHSRQALLTGKCLSLLERVDGGQGVSQDRF